MDNNNNRQNANVIDYGRIENRNEQRNDAHIANNNGNENENENENQNINIRNDIDNDYNNLVDNNNIINYNIVGGKANIYVDNPSNRRLGRVGKGYRKKSPRKKSPEKKCPRGKIRSPKGRCVKEIKPIKQSKPIKPTKTSKSGKTIKIYKLLFSTNILVFDKKYDMGFKIHSLDKKNKPNKELEKYIDFNKLITWHKEHIMDMGEYMSNDKMQVTINEVNKDKTNVMAVIIKVVYDTPEKIPYKKDVLPRDDIEFIGSMIESADDDGNYPIKVNKSSKYKTNALVGSKVIHIADITGLKMKPSRLVSIRKENITKVTTTKEHGKVRRLSAGAYYRKHGEKGKRVLGDVCQIRDTNKELKCLLARTNGTVYWAKKSKNGAGQKICGSWRENCKE